MQLKTKLLILFIISTGQFSWGQDLFTEDLGYQKGKIEVALLFNYNSTFSTGSPLNIYRFYDYRNYPVFHELRNAKADYELRPQLALNLNLFTPTLFNFNLGLGLEYTENNIQSLSTEIHSSTKAELFFEGQESRVLIKPFLGYRNPKFYIYGNLVAGYGFSRDFNTYLKVTDLRSNTAPEVYQPNQEYFHDENVSFGFGFSFAYIFNNGINLGFAYNNYWIGISRSFEFLAIQSHGLWESSYSLSVGYDLFSRS